MATLPTTVPGTFTNISSTAISGSEPVLEAIASADDADYVYDATNSTHTGEASFALADMPTDFGTMATLSVRLRYHWAAGTQTNTWDSLRARVFKSDGTTALTAEATVASTITTTTATTSSVIAFTGVDTAASKTDWDGAVLRIYWFISRVKGGDTLQKRVTAGELTGTYNTAATALLAEDVQSVSEVSVPAVGQVHAITAADVESASQVSQPVLGQTHALTAGDVESSSEVTIPAIAVVTPLTADDVEASTEVTVPSLGQVHALGASDTEAATEVSIPAVGQAHGLNAADVQSVSEVSAPALVELSGTDALTADDVESSSEVSSPSLGQVHGLTAASVEASSEVSTPAINAVSETVSRGGFMPARYIRKGQIIGWREEAEETVARVAEKPTRKRIRAARRVIASKPAEMPVVEPFQSALQGVIDAYEAQRSFEAARIAAAQAAHEIETAKRIIRQRRDEEAIIVLIG